MRTFTQELPVQRAQATSHDHAWRRTETAHREHHLLLGEYRCDLCRAVWAL